MKQKQLKCTGNKRRIQKNKMVNTYFNYFHCTLVPTKEEAEREEQEQGGKKLCQKKRLMILSRFRLVAF